MSLRSPLFLALLLALGLCACGDDAPAEGNGGGSTATTSSTSSSGSPYEAVRTEDGGTVFQGERHVELARDYPIGGRVVQRSFGGWKRLNPLTQLGKQRRPLPARHIRMEEKRRLIGLRRRLTYRTSSRK